MSEEASYKNEFANMSKRFLLLLIWNLKRKNGQVNGVTSDVILAVDPSDFKREYQIMSQTFGNKINLLHFCGESSKKPLEITFADMCIAMANCIFCSQNTDDDDEMISGCLKCAGSLRSPILFLCDFLSYSGKISWSQEYYCFDKSLDGIKIRTYRAQLFERVDFTDSTPSLCDLPEVTRKELAKLYEASETILAFEPRLELKFSDSEEKSEFKLKKSEVIEICKEDSRLSRSPSLVERIIGNIFCFIFFVGCGFLSITAFNAALDFTTSSLMLPHLSYTVNLVIGTLSGAISISLFVLVLFRILNSGENQNELQKRMEKTHNPLEKFWLRARGAHEEPHLIGDAIAQE
jgi:hypothetical protein